MKCLVYFSLLFICFKLNAAPVKLKTQTVMQDVLTSFADLVPYMSQEIKFSDPTNHQFILGKIEKIEKLFKNADHLKQLKSPGFKPSHMAIKRHLHETLLSFQNTDDKSAARLMLKNTVNLCISCHTQLPASYKSKISNLPNQKLKSEFESDYELAEYFYLVRDYKKAISNYEKVIDTNLEKQKKINLVSSTQFKVKSPEFVKSFERVLSIYTKINPDPEKAISFFNVYLTPEIKPLYDSKMLQAWVDDLSLWSKDKKLKSVQFTKQDIDHYIEKYLKQSAVLPALSTSYILTGIFNRYLNYNPKDQFFSQILYWLSYIEMKLIENNEKSLGRMYLRDCIYLFPESFWARQCLEEYEKELKLLSKYYGRLETEKEINELRKSLK